MTWQRKKNAMTAFVHRVEKQVDDRGNTHKVAVRNDEPVKVWLIPQRSAKAEVPGQQQIDVVRIGTKVLEGVDLWSQVEIAGVLYDVVAPPSYRHGTPHVRHLSIDLRKRP